MKVVVAFSGGLDSTVLIHRMRSLECDVFPLTVDYGQKHRREIEAAIRMEPTTEIVRISGDIFKKGALTTNMDVPDGHYEDESMRDTVVPNRNMVLIALAASYAVTVDAQAVAIATHSGDHAIYPDCRPEFLDAMAATLEHSVYNGLTLFAPFKSMSKARIVELGVLYQAPLSETWSCYKGGEAHCGTCGTCFERKEAFALAGVDDPTTYLVSA